MSAAGARAGGNDVTSAQWKMPSEATAVALVSLLLASMVPRQRVEGTLRHFLACLVWVAISAAVIKHPGQTRVAPLSVACLEMV